MESQSGINLVKTGLPTAVKV